MHTGSPRCDDLGLEEGEVGEQGAPGGMQQTEAGEVPRAKRWASWPSPGAAKLSSHVSLLLALGGREDRY